MPSTPSTIPVPPYRELTPSPPAGEPKAPMLTNGATRYGIFGPPKMRHPWELPLLGVGVVVTLIAMVAWWILVIALLIMLITGQLGPQDVSGPSEVEPATTWAGVLGQGIAQILGTTMAQVFIIVGFLWLAIWIARALMYAQIRTRAIRMSPTQFPEGYRMVVEAAQQYGLRRVPDAYVMLGNGTINAFASGHGFRRFVVVYSDLFEVGGAVRDPEALRFIIAHEVGHLAAGHVSYFRLAFTTLIQQIPILGMAYSRAQEYTADNFGYQHCPAGAPGTVAVLGAGKYLNAHVNTHELADRAATEKGFWLHLSVWLTATHPPTTWRAYSLRDRSRPGPMWRRPRRPTFISPLPVGSDSSRGWPTPEAALALLETADAQRPETHRNQFGRFPGVDYTGEPSLRDLQVSTPWQGAGQSVGHSTGQGGPVPPPERR